MRVEHRDALARNLDESSCKVAECVREGTGLAPGAAALNGRAGAQPHRRQRPQHHAHIVAAEGRQLLAPCSRQHGQRADVGVADLKLCRRPQNICDALRRERACPARSLRKEHAESIVVGLASGAAAAAAIAAPVLGRQNRGRAPQGVGERLWRKERQLRSRNSKQVAEECVVALVVAERRKRPHQVAHLLRAKIPQLTLGLLNQQAHKGAVFAPPQARDRPCNVGKALRSEARQL
mmetsp:Transcript_15061/g.44395  ORF Transcript_15061/g.44395 Transcript_15061/m.44395 type:complete len:236 (-) Transcript_15061:74-781(-)|eukprot:363801-Chlamydomonas_euryale.AAC.5